MNVTDTVAGCDITVALEKLCNVYVAEVASNPWTQWNVFEPLLRNLSAFSESSFLAYWAMCKSAVWSSEYDTIVYAAVILCHRNKQ